MSSTNCYASALAAASEAASTQRYPKGALYVVATPIGNLADISLRALHVLYLVETAACEDTRHSQALMRAYGIDKNPSQLLAVHQHNEVEASRTVIDRLHGGQRVAYLSDAGTPGVSDPGARLVAAVRAEGLQIIPLPGASSITTLLSAAGVPAGGSEAQGFLFAGFIPVRSAERDEFISDLASESRCVVLLEAPHRIVYAANALSSLGKRRITVGRELTKQFEEIAAMSAVEFPVWLQANPSRTRGEFVLAIHPGENRLAPAKDLRVLKLLLAELPLKTAVRLAAEITGESKNDLYGAALGLRDSAP